MKTVFITGGTGSFGQGFVKLLLSDPDISMVRVFSRDEHKQRVMRSSIVSDRISYYIGDVRDKDRLKRAMDGSHWVVHAAALKQAPLGEIEPQEFIKTNVLGTINVIEAALDAGVERALMISTDKAVLPINLYGATKMCAEKSFLRADDLQRQSCPAGSRPTRFACTRYGNVAGTSGSIVPLLMSLKDDEPTPIYDPNATRFWITLHDANVFVLNCLKSMEGGEVFLPDMKAASVLDIAEAIRPGKPIKVLGPRPGDKTHELLSPDLSYSSDRVPRMTIDEIRRDVYGRD